MVDDDDFKGMFDVEIPVPKAGARLFDPGRDDAWQYGTSLHMPGNDRWDAYAIGFKQLADLGVEAVGERRTRGSDVYPDAIVFAVMFNYRQYLEVRTKGLILAAERLLDRAGLPAPFGHDLVALWRRLRPLLEAIWPEDEYYDTIESQIAEFASVDPGGDAFRYPVDRVGQTTLTAVRGINLMHVKEIVAGIDSILDGADTGIWEMLQHKYEALEYAREEERANWEPEYDSYHE